MELITQTKFSNPSSAVSLDVSRGMVSCSRPSRTQLSMECMQEDHFGHAGANHLFLYSHQSRSFLCNCSSTHRATDISRDCRPWAIDNINHVQCGSAPCIMLDGKPRLSSRLRAAYIPVVVAVWLAGLKHQPHHHPATLGPPCYFAPSDEIRAA